MFSKNNVEWLGIDDEYRHNLKSLAWSRYYQGNPFLVFKENTLLYLGMRETILDYAGEDVCVNPMIYNPELKLDLKINTCGKPFYLSDAALVEEMPASQCFSNAYQYSRQNGLQLCLGFYLGEEGMWRKHAWCLDHDGKVIEVTNLGIAYFGFVIDGSDMDEYVETYIEE